MSGLQKSIPRVVRGCSLPVCGIPIQEGWQFNFAQLLFQLQASSFERILPVPCNLNILRSVSFQKPEQSLLQFSD